MRAALDGELAVWLPAMRLSRKPLRVAEFSMYVFSSVSDTVPE